MADPNLPPRPPGSSSGSRTGAPVWSITRRERTEMTPPAHSRSSSGERGEEETSTSRDPHGIYQARTVTSTERVQIVQMPMELSEVSAEQLRMLSLSPQTEASREVCTTMTTIEAGAVPIVGGVNANGVPLVSGIFLNKESRQTTTIITTTTTTYKIYEDEGSSDGMEFVGFEGEEAAAKSIGGRPLRMLTRGGEDDFVLVKEGTESSITSTSEDEGPGGGGALSSLTSGDEREETMLKGMALPAEELDESAVATTSIVVIPAAIRSPPYSPHSFANTSTFSSRSSEGNASEFVQFDEAELSQHLEQAIATRRRRELEEEPLERWVSLPDGRRDGSTQTVELLRKTPPSIRWTPVMEIASTSKWVEAKSAPMDEYVATYSDGFSAGMERAEEEEYEIIEMNEMMVEEEEGEEKQRRREKLMMERRDDEVKEEMPAEAEKRPGTVKRITQMFRRSTREERDYPPITEPYSGPIEEILRGGEMKPQPIEGFVTVYSTGRSDEVPYHGVATTMVPAEMVPTMAEYPISTAAYEGPLESTFRRGEMEGMPLDSHVSAYHHGRSDLEPVVHEKKPTPLEAEKKPGTLERLTHIFRRSTKEEGYPQTSVPYTGTLAETSPQGDLGKNPLDQLVTVYSSGRSDEVRIEPAPIAAPAEHVHYPISVPYEGPLASTSRHSDLDGLPMDAHVSAYHHGRSDQQEVPSKYYEQADDETITTMITSIIKNAQHEPELSPISVPYLGQINETQRSGEIEGMPLEHHVTTYNIGHYDQLVTVPPAKEEMAPAEHEKKGALEKLTHLFKRKAEDFPAITEPYSGPVSSTGPAQEAPDQPIHTMVSLYSSGRSDEMPTTTTITTTRKLVGTEYPPIEETPYTGYVPETMRHGELEGIPLDSHVTAYHPGRSDLHLPPAHEEKEPTPSEAEKKPGTLERLTHLFRRSTHEEGYPLITEPYTGTLAETSPLGELGKNPLDQLVTVYSSGRSDEVRIVPAPVAAPAEHIHYPISVPYEGPLASTSRHSDLDGLPMDAHVSAYHHGRSDQEPTTVVPAEMVPTMAEYPISTAAFEGPLESTFRRGEMEGMPLDSHVSAYHHGRSDLEPAVQETITTKITSIFKKTEPKEEFPPISAPYLGPVDETRRFGEIKGMPLEHHVTTYNIGHYDQLATVPPAKEEMAPVEHEKKGALEKLTHLFKRSKTEDFPAITEPYSGPISSTGPAQIVPDQPIHTMVSLYSSGRSDEMPTTTTITTTRKVVSSEYPPIEENPYTGYVPETMRHGELEGIPLDTHVTAYHPGRSDLHMPPAHEEKEPTPSEAEKKPGTLEWLTHLFRRSTHEEGYPLITEPYTGTLAETSPLGELGKNPLDQLVTVYSSGRSDEVRIVPAPVAAPAEHIHYPISVPYEGPLASTSRHSDLDGLPMDAHVSAYHHGRSDQEPTTVVPAEMVPTMAEYPISTAAYEGPLESTFRKGEMEGMPLDSHVSAYHHGRSDLEPAVHETITTKITSIFKKAEPKEEFPPISAPYLGPVDETRRFGDIEGMPLEHHVTTYNIGHYDQLVTVPPAKEEMAPAEHEKKGALEKLTHLFKRSKTEDFPAITEPYSGPVSSTGPAQEAPDQPIHTMVSLYSSGRSDEMPTTTTITTTRKVVGTEYPLIEETPYTGYVPETMRHGELEGIPLDSHVTAYHPGRSDLHIPPAHEEKEPTPSEAEKKPGTLERLTHLFRRSTHEEGYPLITEPYTGTLAETSPQGDLGKNPLDQLVTVYSSGRSDEVRIEPAPIAAPAEHVHYPISVPYEGPLASTSRHSDLDGLPMDAHVSAYHDGRSDQEPTTVVPAEMVPTMAEYPISTAAYEGPLESTFRRGELEGMPLDSHVSAYHHGRSDLEPAVQETITTKITSIFKKAEPKEEFPPISAPYLGPVDETRRFGEIEGMPLEHHVTTYNIGHYDQLATVPPAKEEMAPAEHEKKGALEKLTHLFKRSKTEDFPAITEPYSGPVSSTGPAQEVPDQPIHTMVSLYTSGRSDEMPTTTTITTTRKLVSTEYPPIEETPYTGYVPETMRHGELEGIPLDTHVTAYHPGRSDLHLPPAHEEKEPTPSEAEKKPGTLERLTHLFRRSTHEEGYPLITEPYTGTLAETSPLGELGKNPLDQLVTVYSSGRSDEVRIEPAPVAGPTEHVHYPISVPYEGPLASTSRHSDLDGLPMDAHVSAYHHGRSDQEPTTVVPAEMVPTMAEYPISTAAFEGPLESTFRKGEMEGMPLDSHVSAYHHGRSDLEPAVQETITTKITSIFKKTEPKEEFPPITAPYLGPVDETRRFGEIEGMPLEHHVTTYNIGHYDQLATVPPAKEEMAPVEHEKKGALEKLTHLFKRSKTEDFPAITEPYSGPISSTGPAQEVPDQPIHTMVSLYSSGRSDEMTTTTRKVVGTEYPPIEETPYTGYVPETMRHGELEGIPLDSHVTAYHPGRSDLHMPPAHEEKEPTPSEAEKKPGTLERLTHLFRRSTHEEGYPLITEPYTGALAETSPQGDLGKNPLDQLVTVYSSGRSDEVRIEPAPVAAPAEHVHYPISVPYEGPLASTSRHSDLDGLPMDAHVSAYHHGRSDQEPTTVVPAEMVPTMAEYPISTAAYEGPLESTFRKGEMEGMPLDSHVSAYHHGRSDLEPAVQETITTKITSIFKKTEPKEEFPPITAPYLGPVDETRRFGEIEGMPLEHHVTTYNIGHYDQLATVPPAKEEMAPVEHEKKGALEKLTHLFKRSKTEDFPAITEPYSGPISSTGPAQEVPDQPIHTMVSIYSPGRSDEIPTITTITTTRKLVSSEYPPIEETPYTGYVPETMRHGELEGIPLDSHVTAYHPGRSDLHMPPAHEEKEPTPSEAEKKPGTLEKITHLFRRSTHEEGYPLITEPYTGTLAETSPQGELGKNPLDQLVTVYSSGRSDEVRIEPAPVAAPAEHVHYPISVPYEGPLASTSRHSDLDGLPMDAHVSAYHHGRSDQEPTTVVPAEMVPTMAEYPISTAAYEGPLESTFRRGEMEGMPLDSHVSAYHHGRSDLEPAVQETITTKITSIFKKAEPKEEFPPISAPYLGPVDETRRLGEIEGMPLEHQVTTYNIGHYDQLVTVPPAKEEMAPAEHEKKGALEKLAHLFKRSKTEDFPAITEPYSGPVSSTGPAQEVPDQPIHTMVSVYSPGRSDEIPTITTITTTRKLVSTEYPPIEETPYTGYVPETMRHGELEGIPLDSHVTAYHPGRSDLHMPPAHEEKEPTPSEAEKKPGTLEKITHLFRRSTHEERYPLITEPYTGTLAETSPQGELGKNPLDQQVTVYSSGRSDEVRIEPAPVAAPAEHVHYPISVPYEGPLASTSRHSDLDGLPMDAHVSAYHHGRSDQEPTTVVPAEMVPTMAEYPISTAAYEGPLESTFRRGEMEGMPLDSYVSAYHHGRSDLEPAVQETITTKITSIFKKAEPKEEFPPISAPYLGPVDETRRLGEIEGMPLEHHVTTYNIGHYDQLVTVPPAKEEMAPAEHEKKGALEKLAHLFKRSKTEDFPAITEPYSGPVSSTGPAQEVPDQPIHTMVSVYSPGRSDEIPTITTITTTRKLVSTEYPPIEETPYTGYVPETMRHGELEGIPLDSHVTAYHPGRSDLHMPPAHEEKEPTPSEAEKKPGTLEKITHLFRRSTHEEGYPLITEPYTGTLAGTSPLGELGKNPLDQLVTVYSSGRSDEVRIEPAPVAGPTEHVHYPISVPYEGPLASTSRHSDLDGLPMDAHVSAYHHGRSDQEPTTVVPAEMVPTMAEYPISTAAYEGPLESTFRKGEMEGMPLDSHVSAYHHGRSDLEPAVQETITTKITSIFKKTEPKEEFPPITAPYLGPVDETRRFGEIEGMPLEHHVTTYNIGHYDQLATVPPAKEEMAPVEHEKKGALEKLTHLFKRSKTEDFPAITEPYSGPISSTGPAQEVPDQPIHTMVSLYSSGRSDEMTTTTRKVVGTEYPPIEETPYTGYVPETMRHGELEGIPLDSHVTAYHPGRSDLHMPPAHEEKEPTPSEAEKKPGTLERLTHLFRRSTHEEGYPLITEPYTGALAETSPQGDLGKNPLDQLVTVYSSGRSDEVRIEPAPVAAPAEHVHYPISVPYEGPLASTSRHSDLDGLPMDAHVSAYHHGRSDQEPTTVVPAEMVPTMAEYPISTAAFEGPLESTFRKGEMEGMPLDSHVSAYHHGRSDLEPAVQETITTKITSIFKKTEPKEEFPPITAPYLGPVDETRRFGEIEGMPLEHHVTTYNIGHYDQLATVPPAKEEMAPVEHEKKGALEKLTHLFKRSKTEDFPAITEPYSGPISSTGPAQEVPDQPIHTMVSLYSSGRSDEMTTTTRKVVGTEYPPIEETPYTGYVPETMRHGELEGIPLDSHVTAYHPGRSDLHMPPAHEEKEPTPSEAEKKPGTLERLTHLFRRSTHEEGYPLITEPYTGALAETSPQGDLGKNPLDQLVTVYSSGRSDEVRIEPAPVAAPAEHVHYPISVPYEGPLASTSRHSDLDGLPMDAHVSAYHHGRSDQEPTTVVPAEMVPTMAEYPISTAAYEGPLESTFRKGEMEGMPLDSHVSAYHHGRSDLEPAVQETITTKITSIFKKTEPKEEFPPITAPYLGPVDETRRFGEIEGMPLEHHVTTYNIGHYDQLATVPPAKEEMAPVEHEKKGALEKLTHLFKRSKTEDFPAITEPYSGPISSTGPAQEVPDQPIHTMVSIYSPGRSDEIPTITTITTTRKLVSSEYPPIEETPYTGYVPETMRHGELEGIPLDSHVTAYHPGRSDLHMPPAHEEKEPTPSEAEKKPGTLEKITHLFRRSTHEEGYPLITEPYTGTLAETSPQGDLGKNPLDQLVTVYSSGRSDEVRIEPAPVAAPAEHVHYPISVPYEGPLASTSRHSDLDGLPMDAHVSAYHHGRSDQEPTTVVPAEMVPTMAEYPISTAAYEGPLESTFRKGEMEGMPLDSHVSAYHHGRSDLEPAVHETITTKITSIFKKAEPKEEFPPISAPYLGPVVETRRLGEIEGMPLEHHVTTYNIGHYDQLVTVPPAKEEMAPAEHEKKGALEKLTHLFKRSKTEEFPAITEPYSGPVSSTGPAQEVPDQPIHTMVSLYSSGRSDEIPTITTITTTRKLVSTEYPPIEETRYTGYVPETMRHGELEGIPLDSHVTAYHPGRSDLHMPPAHEEKEPTPSEAEKKPGTLEKITHLFRRSTHEEGYPLITEPYTGTLAETSPQGELGKNPLDQLVTVYSSGRSDEVRIEPAPVAAPAEHVHYPISVPYEGPLASTSRHSDLDGLPMDAHVSAYHHGRSDQEPTTVVPAEMVPTMAEYPISTAAYEGPLESTFRRGEMEGMPLDSHVSAYHHGRSDLEPAVQETITTKITSIFKKAEPKEEFPPISAPYLGPVDETRRLGEIEGMPLEHQVTTYNIGHYDQLVTVPPAKEEMAPAEHEKKGALEKLAHLFKRSKTEDFPAITEPYSGPVSSTGPAQEVPDQPIHTMVSVYSPGRSDEIPTITTITTTRKLVSTEYPPIEETPYTGYVPETMRHGELEGIPLDSHVTAYHPGRSDLHMPPAHEEKEPTPSEAEKKPGTLEKITHLFRRSTHEERYPLITEPYTGTLAETSPQGDLGKNPLDQLVTVYSSGRSDEVRIEPAPVAAPAEHVHYPISVPYEGPLASTSRHSDLDGLPMDAHVSAYHHGRSDQEPTTVVPAEMVPTMAEYPISTAAYEGPLESTFRKGEMEGMPLDSHVSAYHHGRSDLEPAVHETITTKITSIFKKAEPKEEFPPISAPYLGPVVETRRLGEIEGMPLEHHVTTYNIGHYDQLVTVPPAKEEMAPAEHEKKGALEKLTHLFKRSKTEEFPAITEPYSGPVSSTGPAQEVPDQPIHTMVSLYSSGRSDEIPTITTITTTRKLVSTEYPPIEETRYTGYVPETMRHGELEGIPLDSHVTAYHPGRSDLHMPPAHEEKEPTPSEAEKKPGTLERLTHLFRRSTHEEGYPLITEPYTGTLAETSPQGDLGKNPLDQLVTVYSSGRSDEVRIEPAPVAAPAEHVHYPISVPYEGPLASTSRHSDLDGLPMDAHVSAYHHGRSDQEPTTVVPAEMVPTMAEYPISTAAYEGPLESTFRRGELEGMPLDSHVSAYHHGRSDLEPAVHETITTKITSIFKKAEPKEEFPPISAPYLGPVVETRRLGEIEGMPLEHHVTTYNIGHYDQLVTVPPAKEEMAPAEHEKKGALEKLTHLFKRSKTEEFPAITEPYSGPVSSTGPAQEVPDQPIHTMVSLYSSGRSDEIPTITTITTTRKLVSTEYPPIEETRYTGYVPETMRHGELEGIPLDSHVTAYHPGRSDLHMPPAHEEKEPTPSEAEKKPGTLERLTHLFRRSTHEEGYPLITAEMVPTMAEYPISTAAYEGPLESTFRRGEMEGMPLDSYVSAYHHGRSDLEPAVQETITTKITSIFKKAEPKEEFPPISAPYLGPVVETRRLGEIEGMPLEHHVTTYNIGHYDQLVTVPPTKPSSQKLITTRKNQNEIRNVLIEDFVRISHHGHSDVKYEEGFFRGSIETIIPAVQRVEPIPKPQLPIAELKMTTRISELRNIPIDNLVSVYHSGDSIQPSPPAMERDGKREDIGIADKHITFTTTTKYEIRHVPIDERVTVYHHGWYGEKIKEEEEMPREDGHRIGMESGQLNIEQDREIHGLASLRDEAPPKPSAQEPVELHVRISEIKGEKKEEEKERIPLDVTKREEEITTEISEKYSKTTSFREERTTFGAHREMKPPLPYDSRRRQHDDLGIDSKPKPRAYYVARYPTAYDERRSTGGGTMPRAEPMKSMRSYTDQSSGYSYYSPGSQRHRGWTTVTETTTMTYAKRHSFDRTVNGRKQHVVEDIIVYNHGRRLPPGLPKSPAPRRTTTVLPSQYLDERYHNISQRYNYYRSRSQDNAQPRKHDKWLQTDDEDFARAAESRSSRSMSRTTHQIRTYRSYSSHLYDRHAYAREYSSPRSAPYREEQNQHWIRANSAGLGAMGGAGEGGTDEARQSRGSTRVDDSLRRTAPPLSTTTQPAATNGLAQYERTVTQYESSLQHGTPRTVRKLHYQRANIEQLPIEQLLSEIPRLRDQSEEDANGILRRHNGTAGSAMALGGQSQHRRILPLETRLLDPGAHLPSANGTAAATTTEERRGRRPPLRRARQSIRNYCAML